MSEQLNLIYEKLQKLISQIIQNLSIETHHDDKISQGVSVAIKNLNILNNQIQKEYDELKRLSEWKRFTIAFYGETNAGKSTLIEALRLLLKEPTKLESQHQFKIQAEKNGLTQDSFDKIRQKIIETEQAINKVEANLQKLNQKKEKNEVAVAKKKLKSLYQIKQRAEIENARLLKEAEHLKQFADGQIIGDGRSDFTRDSTSFDFNYKGHEFTLIDVPGIEGDENIARKPIEEAVKKAHAVFYVTRTPRPPQTHEGESGKKGTMEKIKEHLGAQTEVWTIYNHAVNNPRQLKIPLISQSEEEGLRALDDKLKAELADKYCQSLVVSARPAYLALTQCVVPGSKEANEQKKFLERFSSNKEVLELSGLKKFVEKLSSTIVGNYRSKIKKANLKKVSKVLENATSELTALTQKFNISRKEIRSEVQNAQTQIEVLLEQFNGSLNVIGSKIIRNFEKSIGEQIYNEIDSDISNDEFKNHLKNFMNSQAKALEKNLHETITKEAEMFESEISNIIRRANNHLNNIVKMQNNSLTLDKFDMDIKVDNGIQLFGLISSGVGIFTGVILLASNPAGWTMAFVGSVLALLGALIGAAKSAIGFFSSSYKQSQQRKEADKVIRKAKSRIEPEINDILDKIKNGMQEQIQPVIQELEVPLKQYEAVIDVLHLANRELTSISQDIEYYKF